MGHPKSSTHLRVLRPMQHNNLPDFINARFPRDDDAKTYNFYCAYMLTLLKPWRVLHNDLKEEGQTWSSALSKFISEAPSKIHRIICGICYLHECRASADRDRTRSNEGIHETFAEDDSNDECHMPSQPGESIEDALQAIIRTQTSLAEEIHGRMAIEIVKRAGIFEDEQDVANAHWPISGKHKELHNAIADDLHNLAVWQKQLEADVRRVNEKGKGKDVAMCESGGDVELLATRALNSKTAGTSDVKMIDETESEQLLDAIEPTSLNEEQKRAYDIVMWHLDETIAGHSPPPLRMMTYGEGGTGKSQILQTITAAFKARGKESLLLKVAYTASASSLVGGKTTHVIGGISIPSSQSNADQVISNEARTKLEIFWHDYQYLAIDEMSMLSKGFFVQLSPNISIGKKNGQQMSFGRINVIILGDFHQFPPVARPIRDALFYPSDLGNDMLSLQIGRSIYEE